MTDEYEMIEGDEEEREEREPDFEDLCCRKNCKEYSIGDICDGCGYPLCPMHAEIGAMYCGQCAPVTGKRKED